MSRACIKMCDIIQNPKSGEAAVKVILVKIVICPCFVELQVKLETTLLYR